MSWYVFENKANGFWTALHAQNDFEKSHRDCDATWSANLLVGFFRKNGATNNINLAILPSPIATLYLKAVPIARIETMQLWTNIGHKETFSHGFLVPFIVARWAHVTSVIPRPVIIGRKHLVLRVDVKIFMKLRAFAFPWPVSLLARELPRHPIG